ncbi:MAG: polysaccharide deacetylase family protein [Ktedonobacteraceae bacterium]|nr:polysaccharide deacetylase family protein [Ktedonobacteraceae bacterium]
MKREKETGRQSERVYIGRRTLLACCIFLLLLSGSLTLLLTAGRSTLATSRGQQPSARVQATSAPVVSTSASSPAAIQPTSPAVTTQPALQLSPESVAPSSSSQVQQVAQVQAQDRLLYRGDPNLPEIALTFDDGPNPLYTPQILSILAHYRVKATFFCIGSLVQAYPAIVQQEHNAGHVVGNHTWAHPDLRRLIPSSVAWQLSSTQNAITGATGVRPLYFRPPYGAFNATTQATANQLGLSTILWNVDPRDWSRPGANAIIARVRAQTSNGSIILMHDGGGDRSQTAAALPGIIEWFQQHSYRFVTLQELTAHLHGDSGTQPATALHSTRGRLSPLHGSSPIWKQD